MQKVKKTSRLPKKSLKKIICGPCPLLGNPKRLAKMTAPDNSMSGAASADFVKPENVHVLCTKYVKTALSSEPFRCSCRWQVITRDGLW
jgi:hypothetical protein